MRKRAWSPWEASGEMRRGMRTRYFCVCHMIVYAVFEGLSFPNKKQSQCKLKLCNSSEVLIYEIGLNLSKTLNHHRPRDAFAWQFGHK